jgi:hypothetical protein
VEFSRASQVSRYKYKPWLHTQTHTHVRKLNTSKRATLGIGPEKVYQDTCNSGYYQVVVAWTFRCMLRQKCHSETSVSLGSLLMYTTQDGIQTTIQIVLDSRAKLSRKKQLTDGANSMTAQLLNLQVRSQVLNKSVQHAPCKDNRRLPPCAAAGRCCCIHHLASTAISCWAN